MVNRSFTAVVERNATIREPFLTEPYETGWAKEARWFVRVLAASEGARLIVRTQLSPDGLFWCDAEPAATTLAGTGLHTVPVAANFGQWLALKGEVRGGPEADGAVEGRTAEPFVKLIVYLVLKE